jgi:SSS family transporter
MGFGFADYVTMGLYLAGIVAMGVWLMGRQKDTADYFLGSRNFHWLPVAISMFASLFSAVSFIAAPGEAYNHGMMVFLKSIFVLLGLPPAIILFVRFFRRLSLTTAYEYLEKRFDLKVRLMGSLLFLLLRAFYTGVVLFASAVALGPATGLEVWQSIVLVGVIATVYTTMGGMKSVIWTDVIQFVVLCGGTLLVIGILWGKHPEGVVGIWDYARAEGHTFNDVTNPRFYSLDPFLRVSLWIVIISSVFTKLTLSGADQISIQRYLSTRNERDAVRSLVWGAVFAIPVMFLLYFSGLGLLWFYQMFPDKALVGMTGDEALPHFIATELPPGLGGVMLAAIMAAVMSSVDSGLNSLSTCSITDFYARVLRPKATEARKLRMAQIMTFVWGGLSILSAGLIVWMYGAASRRNNIVTVSEVTIGLFGGILLGVFLLGVLTRRANANGVLLGALGGLAVAIGVITPFYFVDRPADAPKLSFLWVNIIGCLCTIVFGYAASLFGRRPGDEKLHGLTYWDPPAA